MIFPLYELKRVLYTQILSNCNVPEEIFFENLKFFAIIFIRQRHYHDICGKDKTLPPGIELRILAKMPTSPTIPSSSNHHGAINPEVFFDSLQFIVIIKDNL
ncbi:hypothetical protein [Janthinobacterium sp. J1-1]|uniref:hypothetical protein n=1 Tax=Janthinobacterium sp. J1-1 TaxID=3065910 RepID=UPI0028123876|nr:hypothetical protein [Janthinobacterium sp. J1-1]